MSLRRFFPCLEWGRAYDRTALTRDLLAAVIVTIMLIPQSLAYALLAGLPAEVGLYASILPLVAYSVFGTSRALAVGPVAVVSLMTAAAIGTLGISDMGEKITAALTLAALSGLLLVLFGMLRLGFIANLLSHPVISGFITASGLLIAFSQIRHILGIAADGHTLVGIVAALADGIGDTNPATLGIGLFSLVLLLGVRRFLTGFLIRSGMKPDGAALVARAGPVLAVVLSILGARLLDLEGYGVALVGVVPQGLPPLTWPSLTTDLVLRLLPAAALISLIGFVESVSVAQTLAARKRQRIDLDQELVGLGAANLAAAASGGYPVTGGFARSVVNFDAGAETPAAGAFTAAGIALATVFLTPLLYSLPKATLAATIIVAVLSLVDLGSIRRTWRYSKSDFTAMAATISLTLTVGVEAGVTAGVLLSVLLFLFKTSRPHMAIVGLVPGSEHFRNIDRHSVIVSSRVMTLRVDESLYFANARFLEDRIYALAAAHPALEHFVLMCPAVNEIDASALESLEAINDRLRAAGVTFHLSEVKGPVMDRLKCCHFLDDLTGQVFLSQFEALKILDPSVLQTGNAGGN
ncbi:SulP family inorganic anion transporter [Eilatimonas milleporae]|uniref:SulP family sulfate permease n=1 Tax=Eilatimonas milleporae TaxID=911205 RepID=A0A3M0CEH6_9PROT|nr:sulfate permease [Eilatimonas milleporae]RMB01423.1 SulP family sulfate permease [Eilatimonas milleporae]